MGQYQLELSKKKSYSIKSLFCRPRFLPSSKQIAIVSCCLYTQVTKTSFEPPALRVFNRKQIQSIVRHVQGIGTQWVYKYQKRPDHFTGSKQVRSLFESTDVPNFHNYDLLFRSWGATYLYSTTYVDQVKSYYSTTSRT